MTFRVLFTEQVFIPERWAAGTKDEHNFLREDSYEFTDGNLVIALTQAAQSADADRGQIVYHFPAHAWKEVKGENHPAGARAG